LSFEFVLGLVLGFGDARIFFLGGSLTRRFLLQRFGRGERRPRDAAPGIALFVFQKLLHHRHQKLRVPKKKAGYGAEDDNAMAPIAGQGPGVVAEGDQVRVVGGDALPAGVHPRGFFAQDDRVLMIPGDKGRQISEGGI
jgi:hypothetical protein